MSARRPDDQARRIVKFHFPDHVFPGEVVE